MANAEHQRFLRSLQYQRRQSWRVPASRPGLDQSLPGPVTRAYFNLAAFAPTPAGAGRFGNAGVGILQGPGTAAASLGLAKAFNVREGVKVRFESTFTNVLNHTNFAPPPTQIDVPSTFGVLSAPQTAENAGNRTGQLALRIEF